MADKKDLAGIGAGGEFGGQGFAFGFVVGEADFDQTMIGQSLIERGENGIGHGIMSDMDDGFEFLGARFEFAELGFVHEWRRKRE